MTNIWGNGGSQMLVFVAVKFVGYSFFAALLGRLYGIWKPMLLVGFVRTVMGIVLGTVYSALFASFFRLIPGVPLVMIWVALIPLRLFEWWLIVRWFYSGTPTSHSMDFFLSPRVTALVGGTLFSFLLDIPVLLGMVAMGGISTC